MTFHPGELAAQQRFTPEADDARRDALARIIGHTLSDGQWRFIDQRPFFFLATASADGACDCSFRGSESGQASAARVIDAQTLWFPDYPGNGLFNSLGNLVSNPQLGLLFIDFAAQRRLRVNGHAELLDTPKAWAAHWPDAPRAVRVQVEQVYWNCSKRIPIQP